MKKLANLKGAKALNKKEQQSINGGAPLGGGCFNMDIMNGGGYGGPLPDGTPCGSGMDCCQGKCTPIGTPPCDET